MFGTKYYGSLRNIRSPHLSTPKGPPGRTLSAAPAPLGPRPATLMIWRYPTLPGSVVEILVRLVEIGSGWSTNVVTVLYRKHWHRYTVENNNIYKIQSKTCKILLEKVWYVTLGLSAMGIVRWWSLMIWAAEEIGGKKLEAPSIGNENAWALTSPPSMCPLCQYPRPLTQKGKKLKRFLLRSAPLPFFLDFAWPPPLPHND